MPPFLTTLKAGAGLALLTAIVAQVPASPESFPAALPSGFETGFRLGGSPRFLSDTVFLSNEQVWDLATSQRLAGTDFHTPHVALIDYHPETDKRLFEVRDEAFEVRDSLGQTLLAIDAFSLDHSDARFSANGQRLLVHGTHLDSRDSQCHAYDIESGTLLWSAAAQRGNHWIPLPKTQRLLRFQKSTQSPYRYIEVALHDLADGSEIDRLSLSGMQLDDFHRSYREPDDRLYLLSGREDWTLLVNAVHDALVLLKDGPLRNIPFLGSPVHLSDDATRVIFDNRSNAFQSYLYLRDAITGDDLVSTNEFRSEKTPQAPNLYSVSGNFKTIYTVADAGLIERWDVDSIVKTGEFSYSNIPFNGIALSRDERTLLAWRLFTREDGFLVAFDTETGEPRYSRLLDSGFELPGGTGLVGVASDAIYFTPDTQRLLVRSGLTTVLDFATGQPLAQLPLAPGPALASAYVHDRKRFLIAYASGLIEEREPGDFSLVDSSYYGPLQTAYDAAIAPENGRIFYTSGTTATVYDPDSKETIWFKTDFGFQSRGATLANDASLVHIPGKGVYDFSQDRYVIENPHGIHNAFSGDGSLYAHAGSDAIQVFHTATGELAYEYDALSRTDALAFSPDSQSLIAAGRTHDSQNAQVVLIEFSLPSGDLQRLATLGSVRAFHRAATPQQIVVSQDRIHVSTWRYTLFALDRNAPRPFPVSLPIGPISSPGYTLTEPRLAGIAPDGSFLYENGNRRLIGATVRPARFAPATLAPRRSGDPALSFDAQSDRRYFLQTSNDLESWATQSLSDGEILPFPLPAASVPVFARVVEIE